MTAKIIKHSKFKLPRGEIFTLYDDRQLDIPFKQDKVSISYKGVVRGFHGDTNTYKLITCLDGVIQLVVHDVDNDATQRFILNSNSDKLVTILVPPRHLNAHQCLSKSCIFLYKWSEYYTSPEDQWSVRYDDPAIFSDWPTLITEVSERDRKAGTLKDLKDSLE